jgi:hypothetical protein
MKPLPKFLPPTMRVLTIRQPCAEAILIQREGYPLKGWENRPKPAPSNLRSGTWIALHAGLEEWEHAAELRARHPVLLPHAKLVRGAIVGAWRYDGQAKVEDVKEDLEWARGPWCYRVGASVRLEEPIPWTGAEGWRYLPIPVETVIVARIMARGFKP